MEKSFGSATLDTKGVTEIKNPIGGRIRNFSLVWDPLPLLLPYKATT